MRQHQGGEIIEQQGESYSHELETVERVCSRVVILHHGKIVADDSIAHLRTLMAAPTLEAIFSQLAVEQDTATVSRQIADLIRA